MHKKIYIAALIALVAVAAVAALILAPGHGPGAKQHMKMGLILPLTGNVAFLGESARNAAKLALADAGQTKYAYDLMFEDDSFDPTKSVTAANKLLSIEGADALVSFGSATGDAVAPIAEAKRVPHFSLASDPTAAKGLYNYIDWTPPFKEGQLLAREIVARGYKRVSIIDTNHPGPLAVTDAVRKALVGTPVQVVSYDLTNVGDKDFRTVVAKVGSLKPNLIVLEMFSPEIELIARQMKAQGITAPLTSVETFEWSDDPSLFEGDWFVSDVRASQEFATEYSAAYGAAPKPGASYIYDLVSLIIRLQEASPAALGPAGLQAQLSTIGGYDSRLFGHVVIDTDGFFLTEASVKAIRNGKAEYAR